MLVILGIKPSYFFPYRDSIVSLASPHSHVARGLKCQKGFEGQVVKDVGRQKILERQDKLTMWL